MFIYYLCSKIANYQKWRCNNMNLAKDLENEMNAIMPMSNYRIGYIFHVIKWQEPQTLVGKGA